MPIDEGILMTIDEVMEQAWKRLADEISYSQKKLLIAIFARMADEANPSDCAIIASDVADMARISRSVSISLFALLNVSGLAKTDSCGTKGTRILVFWPPLFDSIEKLK
jgi:GTP-sensing pleiotropic transcriptional regulator CodY